ncbi:hypothetical protein Bca4012_100907 [Brassica carinata]
MDSNTGSSVARRRRRHLTVSHLTVSIFLLFIFLLHEFLVGLGFFSSFVVASFNRSCLCRKIYPVRFWWECGSCTSPPCPILVRNIILNGSEHYYQTIPARNLIFEDPVTNLCSPRTPLVAVPSDNCSPLQSLLENNDQGLSFGSEKSP